MPVPQDRLTGLLHELSILPDEARFDRLVTEALETDGEVIVMTTGRVIIALHGVEADGGTAAQAVEDWRRRATENDAEDAA